VGQFMHWLEARDSVPAIVALRNQAEEARRAELERALRLVERGEAPAQVMERLSQALTNKLLHAPTEALKKPSEKHQALKKPSK